VREGGGALSDVTVSPGVGPLPPVLDKTTPLPITRSPVVFVLWPLGARRNQ